MKTEDKNRELTLKILEEFSNKIIKTVSTGSGDPDLIQKTADLLCEKTEELNEKADNWDNINAAIAEFYEDYDDDGNRIPPKREGDLCDIGLIAAQKTGWL